jgi:hypothetical protein
MAGRVVPRRRCRSCGHSIGVPLAGGCRYSRGPLHDAAQQRPGRRCVVSRRRRRVRGPPVAGAGVSVGLRPNLRLQGWQRRALAASNQESLNRVGDVAGAAIIDCTGAPSQSIGGRRPDSKNRLLWRKAEPKHSREAGMRRTYDMNKKLADDLCTGLTIVVRGASISTARRHLLGNNKKR